MSSTPLVSVVVPVYNAAKFIDKCLTHLVHQTYKNLEIIIVDDGSQDNSVAVCQKYADMDARIKIMCQENSGPANARNNGLAAATGEYVHFHDSDDWLDLDYYQRMIAAAHTDADVICGEVDEVGFIFPRFSKIDIFSSLTDKIAGIRAHQFNVVWRFLFKRDFLRCHDIKFPSGMFIGEDKIFMWNAIYHANMIATAPGAIYHCEYEPSSLGKNRDKIMRGRPNGAANARQNYLDFMQTSGLTDAIKSVQCGILRDAHHWDLFGLHIYSIYRYTNGDTAYRILGIPVARKVLTQSKVRCYICGMYIWRKYSSIK